MRITFNKSRMTNRAEMFQSHNILPIRGICIWKTLKFVHAALHQTTHTSFQPQINDNPRAKFSLVPTKATNNYGEKLVSRLGPNMFNSMPENIRNIEAPKKFSKEVKKFILSNGYLNNFFTSNVNFFSLFKKYSD